MVNNTTSTPSSTHPFISQIECHYCHAKGHITSHCPQHTLVLKFKDDNLLEDTDEFLVIDPNYEDDPSVMYEDDSPLMKITFL